MEGKYDEEGVIKINEIIKNILGKQRTSLWRIFELSHSL